MKVNCLEKNPAVERHYASMSNEQRLAEIDDSMKSLSKILENLLQERIKVLKEITKTYERNRPL